jgi:hypothetical protein
VATKIFVSYWSQGRCFHYDNYPQLLFWVFGWRANEKKAIGDSHPRAASGSIM